MNKNLNLFVVFFHGLRFLINSLDVIYIKTKIITEMQCSVYCLKHKKGRFWGRKRLQIGGVGVVLKITKKIYNINPLPRLSTPSFPKDG